MGKENDEKCEENMEEMGRLWERKMGSGKEEENGQNMAMKSGKMKIRKRWGENKKVGKLWERRMGKVKVSKESGKKYRKWVKYRKEG